MDVRLIAAFIALSFFVPAEAQGPRTKNVIVVTLDGLRWEEFFKGVDAGILRQQKYLAQEEAAPFWHPDETVSRKLLMPFIWDRVALRGQLYGNRDYGNKVNCTNRHLLSYPGYSEMLVGFTHRKVSSNAAVNNPHATVLEIIEKQRGFQDQVAAFATWDAFSYIFRESTSDIYVNAGPEPARGKGLSRQERMLNKRQRDTQARSDSLTFQYAMEYLKRERPRVLFIGLDETDQHAHGGRYGEYLRAAHRADQMIGSLWQWIQSQADYRDQTTLFITTDHGRGRGNNNWRVHRLLAAGSRHIWFAVLGPDTPAFGEMRIRSKNYQKQVAKTIAAFLGVPYDNVEPVGEVLQTMIAVPQLPTGETASASGSE